MDPRRVVGGDLVPNGRGTARQPGRGTLNPETVPVLLLRARPRPRMKTTATRAPQGKGGAAASKSEEQRANTLLSFSRSARFPPKPNAGSFRTRVGRGPVAGEMRGRTRVGLRRLLQGGLGTRTQQSPRNEGAFLTKLRKNQLATLFQNESLPRPHT